MDTDREFEHMMMSVRNSSGSISQMVYAANMLQIKLLQFVARLAYKGYLSIKSRDDLAAFAKLSEGKYTIYSIPVSTEHVNDLKQLEALKLKLQSVSGKDEKKQIQNDIGILKARIDADSPVEQLKEKGLKQCCVLPKLDGESGTIQIAVMNKDDQIFKSWFASHIRVQMAGGKKEITDLKNFTEGNYTMEQYKNKYLKSASDFRGEIWIKMYSNFELEHPMRKIYNATWLDYEKQLEQGNIIYDENEVCGIWAMSKSFCHKVFDEKCIEHYGDRVLIVEPIDGELYFNDGPELIGKRYLVKGKYNMRLSHDRALYVEKLMELSNSISNEHNDETSFEINNELANTRMYCRDLEYRLKISKIMKWAFLILGMILGIIINLLV